MGATAQQENCQERLRPRHTHVSRLMEEWWQWYGNKHFRIVIISTC